MMHKTFKYEFRCANSFQVLTFASLECHLTLEQQTDREQEWVQDKSEQNQCKSGDSTMRQVSLFDYEYNFFECKLITIYLNGKYLLG